MPVPIEVISCGAHFGKYLHLQGTQSLNSQFHTFHIGIHSFTAILAAENRNHSPYIIKQLETQTNKKIKALRFCCIVMVAVGIRIRYLRVWEHQPLLPMCMNLTGLTDRHMLQCLWWRYTCIIKVSHKLDIQPSFVLRSDVSEAVCGFTIRKGKTAYFGPVPNLNCCLMLFWPCIVVNMWK